MHDHVKRLPNRNFNTPRANFGHLTIFCARRGGNFTGKAFLRMGNLTFAWVVGGEIEPLVSGFKRLVVRKGGFPLSRNFYARTDVNFNWLYVRKLK